jgi:RNA 2',3'-cyclic 3'-phosphodiesterase
MDDQFSLPGFDNSVPPRLPAPPTPFSKSKPKRLPDPYSLFFSIFPTPTDATEIAGVNGTLLRMHGLTGRPLPPHRLHVTCHDLGNYAEVPQDMVDAAIGAGNALASGAFDVVFDSALSYPSSGTYVLSGREGTRQLTAFREALGEALRSKGLRVKPGFTPHMTMVYDRHFVAEHSIEPVRWRALEFVLIRSHVGKGIYDVLGRWPLAG